MRKSYLKGVFTFLFFFIALSPPLTQNKSPKESNNKLFVINKLKSILKDNPDYYLKEYLAAEKNLI